MRLIVAICTLLLAVSLANGNPMVKRAADEDLSPLNEVYMFEVDDDDQSIDEDRGDREKRKIGVVKLGVTNGILNFVFGKLDAFLDAKTKALGVLDESNKAKNAAFGIDSSQSATGQFISNLISQKIAAGTASIGPIINSATTFASSASSGLAGAFASKFAPLSSLSGGAGSAGAGGSGGPSGVLGGLLTSGLGSLSSLSGSSSGSAGSTGSSDSSSGSSQSAGAGVNLGAFANIGGGIRESTTEDIPEFDRTKVSLDIPAPAFGSGFSLVTNVSKVLSSVIINSARRTQTLLEVFKPFFRGIFAIKGLPSDNPK
ncbi:keratin, type II cytoskeletal 1 [Prorops nasuta]|uniref:keratin, type II cytoskeletal 1 n=1 Tax=Prorops nasuta TaxID=863751 RepID=UPI0034D00960